MIKEKERETTGNPHYDLEITCDHCFDIILFNRGNEPIKQYFEYVYGPQLCETCWKVMGNRIHELTEIEKKYEELVNNESDRTGN